MIGDTSIYKFNIIKLVAQNKMEKFYIHNLLQQFHNKLNFYLF